MTTIFKLKLLSILLFFSIRCFGTNSAVILQYHHVSENTPATTSISPATLVDHIEWLNTNEFLILPLEEIITTLQGNKSFAQPKVAAITFDDANRSVCETAWPILQQYNLPFTLFISTEAVNKRFQSQCTWEQLKQMTSSGLMTPANHSHRHLNMISGELTKDIDAWQRAMREEIKIAQELIQQNLGKTSTLFAYPYGEYNSSLTTIVKEADLIGFGQHSGAISSKSDFSALPRFPASGTFSNLETLSTKLLSLDFPVTKSASVENPIALNSLNNPPRLTLTFSDTSLLNTTRCYNNSGESLGTIKQGSELVISSLNKLNVGRHRYTCTSKSPFPNRFYWLSHQWLIEDAEDNSFSSFFEKMF